MANNNKRPIFLNIARIHLPVTAVLSIAHRLTGLLMVLLIPVGIYILDLSLRDAADYQQVISWLDTSWMRTILILTIWFIAHHFFSGVRYLLLDIDIGIEAAASRKTAWLAILAGGVTMFIGAWVLL